MESTQLLLKQISHLYLRRSFGLMSGLDIHPGQVHLLECLYQKNGASQKELARSMNTQPSTVTMAIRRMGRSNWVIRKQDEQDKRVQRIFLTKQGERAVGLIHESQRQLDKEVFDGFTKKEIELLYQLLSRVRDNLIHTLQPSEKRR